MDEFFFQPVVANGVGLGQYILLGWNDLGMHCYNRDFQDLAVLPPYNTLWAQVIKRGRVYRCSDDLLESRLCEASFGVGRSPQASSVTG